MSHSLSAATTDMPRRGWPSGSRSASGTSKNRRSFVAMTGFLTGRPCSSTRVSVPRPSSATDTEPSPRAVTTHRPPPRLAASSAA
ncbi:hypothetical protein [Streptomyces sp. NPDC004065]|uniref:hypothetical protein n=1 Tax=Streptomyces sp. NPDC004065 TaxID=3364689 RepID=UPI00384F3B77